MSDPNTQPEPTMEEILASIRRIISEEEEGDGPEVPDADEKGSVIEEGDLSAALEEEAPELADEDAELEAALEAEMDPEDSPREPELEETVAEEPEPEPSEPELEETVAEEPEPEPNPDAEEVGQPLDLEGLAEESADFDETVLELTEFVDVEDLDDESTEDVDANDLVGDLEDLEDLDDERSMHDGEPAAGSQPALAPQLSATAEQVVDPTPLSKLDFSTLVSEEAAAQTSTAFVGFAEQLQQSRGVALGSSARTLEELVKDLLRPMLKEWLDENLPPLVQRLVEREIAKLAGHADDK